jgi:hypothetical protein
VSAAVGEIGDGAAPGADDAVLEAPAVLRIVWADPQHMAEQIAVWSLHRFGPRAGRAVDKLREKHPDADRAELERLVIERQTRIGMAEGAFVGGPFIVLIVVAFVAALLAQAQMVFELAAVAGRSPTDQMRAAELLVLLGAYPTTEDALAALQEMKTHPRDPGKKLPRGTRWSMIMKMGYLLEVFGPSDPTRTKLRSTLGWIGVGFVFLVGLVLPLVWVPYMAYAMRKSSLRLASRAVPYYAGETSDAGVTVTSRRISVGGTAALARTLLLLLLPVAAAIVAFVAGLQITGGSWVSALLLLLLVSAAATLGWLAFRWWRRRRRLAASVPG